MCKNGKKLNCVSCVEICKTPETIEQKKIVGSINDIDLKNTEGQLLFAALIMLSMSESFCFMGEQINGTHCTPDFILNTVKKVSNNIVENL